MGKPRHCRTGLPFRGSMSVSRAMRAHLLPTLAVFYASQAAAQAQPVAPLPTAPAPPPAEEPRAPSPAAPAPPAPSPAAPPGATYPYPSPGYVPYPAPGQPPETAYPRYPAQGYSPPFDPRPRFLPYRPGEPAPPGYRYDEQVRRGAVIGGAITGGVPYLLGLLVASSENFTNKRGFLVLPALGPWLTLLTRDSTCDAQLPISECTEDFSTRLVLTIDGLLQTGGAILIASGVLNPRKRYVLEGWGGVTVSARVYPGGGGLGASGHF